MTEKYISDGLSDKKGHICWLSHWGGWVLKPGLGATLLSGIFPCDWKGAEKGPNWVWRLKCPFSDLAVTELPSCNWRLFPPSNLQSPEFNSPESITACEEGAWLMQQLQTAPATAFRDPLHTVLQDNSFWLTLPNGISSNMVLHEH